MGVAGDLVHPDGELVLAVVGGPVLEDADEDVLDEVLAGGPVPGQAEEEVEEGDVVALEEDGQLLDPAVPDRLHNSVVGHAFSCIRK